MLAATVGLCIVILALSGCRASATAPVRGYLFEAESIATSLIQSAAGFAPVRTGVRLDTSARGGISWIKRDETSVGLFMHVVPSPAVDGGSTAMVEAIVETLLDEGWEPNPSLTQTADESGEGVDLFFQRADPGDSVDWSGDRPGTWTIELRDRLNYFQVQIWGPYVQDMPYSHDSIREIEGRHPDWERLNDVLLPQ